MFHGLAIILRSFKKNIKDSYEKLFGQAVDEYNGKQKRADRKINNYLQKVKDSTLDHQKEFVMQIGDYQSLEKLLKNKAVRFGKHKNGNCERKR